MRCSDAVPSPPTLILEDWIYFASSCACERIGMGGIYPAKKLHVFELRCTIFGSGVAKFYVAEFKRNFIDLSIVKFCRGLLGPGSTLPSSASWSSSPALSIST